MSQDSQDTNSEVVSEEEVVEKVLFPLPETAEEFLSDIIKSYPESDYLTLRKVIGLGRVVYQDTDPVSSSGPPMTAAVMNTRPYTLIFGKKFMQENMRTNEDCAYVLSHELTHLILDHFAKDIAAEFEEKELGRKAAHIIVDCQVNATVYHSLKEDKYLEFIKRYYTQNEMPYCFFRPDGIAPDEELQELHDRLYSEEGITNKDLIDGLMPWFKEQQDQMDKFIQKCLGNHDDLFRDRAGNSKSDELDDLVEAVGEGIEDYLKKDQDSDGGEEDDEKQSGRKAGKGHTLREEVIKTVLDRVKYARNIKQKLKKVEVVNPSSRIFKAIDDFVPKSAIRSVVPNFHDRRTCALFSTGHMPVFHRLPYKGSTVIVPCYVDVSGSQSHVLPVVLPVVSRLKEKIGNLVYCFSNEVAPTKLQDLARGKYKTTGGTDFSPIAEHIIKNRFKNAVILTDGEADIESRLIVELKRRNVKITVGWTVSNPSTQPLSTVANKTFFVFDKNFNAYD